MKIFPIGDAAGASNQGTVDSISYSLFEPNESCQSNPVYNILQTKYQDQTMITRKRAAPALTIVYNYGDIFTREYRQIEHFLHSVDESLTSFYVVDWSKGITPSNVASAGTKWVFTVDDTHFYSATPLFKANRAIAWNGVSWKEGPVQGVTLNATFSVDVFTSNFGAMPLGDAVGGMVYPMYEVFAAQNVLSNFKPGAYWEEDITTGQPGGYMYSGNANFMSRYKI